MIKFYTMVLWLFKQKSTWLRRSLFIPETDDWHKNDKFRVVLKILYHLLLSYHAVYHVQSQTFCTFSWNADIDSCQAQKAHSFGLLV